MAVTWLHFPFCIAGITFLTAIDAAPSTPHFTLPLSLFTEFSPRPSLFYHNTGILVRTGYAILCYLNASMNLVCQSQRIGDVVLIRCDGRHVIGEESQSLQVEIEKFQLETKKFVLQLAQVTYVDSVGLGAMVRFLGRLRAARGDLKLCQLSPFLQKVFAATNLKDVFQTFSTEREALAAFSHRPQTPHPSSASSCPRIICVDSSSGLLAYLSALLKR